MHTQTQIQSFNVTRGNMARVRTTNDLGWDHPFNAASAVPVRTRRRRLIKKLDKRIQDAKKLLVQIEAKAARLREAIETFKAEKTAT